MLTRFQKCSNGSKECSQDSKNRFHIIHQMLTNSTKMVILFPKMFIGLKKIIHGIQKMFTVFKPYFHKVKKIAQDSKNIYWLGKIIGFSKNVHLFVTNFLCKMYFFNLLKLSGFFSIPGIWFARSVQVFAFLVCR